MKAVQCVSLAVVMNGKVTAGAAAGAARVVWDWCCCLPRESELVTSSRKQAWKDARGCRKSV